THHSCRNAGRGRTRCHISRYDGIGANAGMGADPNRAQDLRAGADIDMALDHWDAAQAPRSNRDLLKDQAVYADLGVGVNDDAIGVRDQEPTANLAEERNFGPSDNGPEAMAQHQPFAEQSGDAASAVAPILISPHGSQKLTAGSQNWRGCSRLQSGISA